MIASERERDKERVLQGHWLSTLHYLGWGELGRQRMFSQGAELWAGGPPICHNNQKTIRWNEGTSFPWTYCLPLSQGASEVVQTSPRAPCTQPPPCFLAPSTCVADSVFESGSLVPPQPDLDQWHWEDPPSYTPIWLWIEQMESCWPFLPHIEILLFLKLTPTSS